VHIHPTQVNPNALLNELHEMQKAAAKRETERVRKKLLDAPAEVEGEPDSYVVELGAREKSGEQAPAKDQRGNQQEKQATSDATPRSISDWA
jgi:hypothetical protein